VLFVYNRPEHTLLTLQALKNNELADESILYVFADGPKKNASAEDIEKINKVRSTVKKEKWCKEVNLIESDINKGLAESVIKGVTEIVNRYGKIIVLEDDIITAKGFLKYMNDALIKFKNDEKVMQISGHSYPSTEIQKNYSSFFLPMATSWGWGSWSRAWVRFRKDAEGYEILQKDKAIESEFNLDNSYPYSAMLKSQMETKKVDSWAIRWWWSIFIEKGLSLFPDTSLINNVGYGNEATHTTTTDPFLLKNFDQNYRIEKFPTDIVANEKYFNAIKSCIRKSLESKNYRNVISSDFTFFRIINNVKRILKSKKKFLS
jgi:hypothetical protein